MDTLSQWLLISISAVSETADTASVVTQILLIYKEIFITDNSMGTADAMLSLTALALSPAVQMLNQRCLRHCSIGGI